MKRTVALALGLALALAAPAAQAQAQTGDYPSRTVTFVVPFAPGGGTDIVTRMLAQEMQDKLKRPVVVENRPGAGTVVAASSVAKAAPDGHTLLLAPITTLAIGPHVHKSLPYDTRKDFAPIGLIGATQFALVANPGLGVETLPELIAYVKERSGKISYATSGSATPHHLFMEVFLKMIGARGQQVAYRGSVAALTDVMGGQVPFMMVDLAVALPLIRDGKVKAFGVTAAERVQTAPEIPTIAEAGLPGFGATGWLSVVAPAGTPQPIVERLNRIMTDYLARPETEKRIRGHAIEPMRSTPEEMRAFVAAEIERWGQVVKDAGIEPK